MKAQSSLEFMIMFSLIIILFTISVAIYFTNVQEAKQIDDHLEATKICIQVSSILNSFAAMEGNSTYTFNLPVHLNYKNYSVWVSSQNRIIKINYDSKGVGCNLHTSNITNSTGAILFEIQKNAILKNNEGVVTIEP